MVPVPSQIEDPFFIVTLLPSWEFFSIKTQAPMLHAEPTLAPFSIIENCQTLVPAPMSDDFTSAKGCTRAPCRLGISSSLLADGPIISAHYVGIPKFVSCSANFGARLSEPRLWGNGKTRKASLPFMIRIDATLLQVPYRMTSVQ